MLFFRRSLLQETPQGDTLHYERVEIEDNMSIHTYMQLRREQQADEQDRGNWLNSWRQSFIEILSIVSIIIVMYRNFKVRRASVFSITDSRYNN